MISAYRLAYSHCDMCSSDVLSSDRRFAESRSAYTCHTLFGYQAFSQHNE